MSPVSDDIQVDIDPQDIADKLVLLKEAWAAADREEKSAKARKEKIKRDEARLKQTLVELVGLDEVLESGDFHVFVEEARRGSWRINTHAIEQDEVGLKKLGLHKKMVPTFPTLGMLREHKDALARHGMRLDDYLIPPPFTKVVAIRNAESHLEQLARKAP